MNLGEQRICNRIAESEEDQDTSAFSGTDSHSRQDTKSSASREGNIHANKFSIFTGSSRTRTPVAWCTAPVMAAAIPRSEEHTPELQSRLHLVCRLLLEKKKDLFPVVPIYTKIYLAIMTYSTWATATYIPQLELPRATV